MQVNLIQNKDCFEDTHFFVYKLKKYPIKYGFFKISSKYFSRNSKEIKKIKDIQLDDDNKTINLSEQSIIDFIKYVHHEPIQLTNENLIEIEYLAKKYEVSSLIEFIKDYIESNNKEIAIQILIIHQKDSSFDTEIYENIISNNFLEKCQEKSLFQIDFPKIYRIFSKFQKSWKENDQNDEIIFEFLFKCIDEYGRKASILFENIDFKNTRIKYLNILILKYSKVFDFNYVKYPFIKALYEQQNNLLNKEIETQKRQEAFEAQIKLEFEKNKEVQKQIYEDDLQKLKFEINKIKTELEQEINSLKNDINSYLQELQNKDDEIKKLKEEYSKLKPITEVKPYCTYSATENKHITQKWYHCKTCNLNGNDGICEVCALNCHKGHDVQFYTDSTFFFCDCKDRCNCQNLPKEGENLECCSKLSHGIKIDQPMYQCKDCNILNDKYICQNCAIKFHKKHNLIYYSMIKNHICQNFI